MASHDQELLKVAIELVAPRAGRKGKLSRALVRRSMSTAYYALFHFLLDEAAKALIGTGHDLQRRRRVFIREFTHEGMKKALDKLGGARVDPSIVDFLRPSGARDGPVAMPNFVRSLAQTFSEAQSKRHMADYDMNQAIGVQDARLLVTQVQQSIEAWRSAKAKADKDAKHAACMLMLLKGKLRRED